MIHRLFCSSVLLCVLTQLHNQDSTCNNLWLLTLPTSSSSSTPLHHICWKSLTRSTMVLSQHSTILPRSTTCIAPSSIAPSISRRQHAAHRRQLMVVAAGSSFGHSFRVTTFGESHGGAVGCVIDGVPPRLPLTKEEIQKELDRRRPGVCVGGCCGCNSLHSC